MAGAGEAFEEFGASGPHESCESEDFGASELQVDILESGSAWGTGVLEGEVAGFEYDVAGA